MSTSPIFVATFADGVCTRMSIYCTPGDLDLERGKRLARYAYESRTSKPAASFTKAHFEDTNGQVLMAYSAIVVNDDADEPTPEPAPEPDAPQEAPEQKQGRLSPRMRRRTRVRLRCREGRCDDQAAAHRDCGRAAAAVL